MQAGKGAGVAAGTDCANAGQPRWQLAVHRVHCNKCCHVLSPLVLKGVEVWNAGRPADAETRHKMSEAKLGKRLSLATRKRMSVAATGRPAGPDVAAAVAAAQRGRPKSPEHRAKLAESARKNHAAVRVLHAVEAVYSAASALPRAGSARSVRAAARSSGASGAAGSSTPGGSGGTAPHARSAAGLAGGSGSGSPAAGSTSTSSSGGGGGSANLGAVRAAAYSMGLTGLADSRTGKRLTRTQILNTFKAELREYRALQVCWCCVAAGLLLLLLLLRSSSPAAAGGSRQAHGQTVWPRSCCLTPLPCPGFDEQEELSTWTAAFCEKHNRKPNLIDVQRTGKPPPGGRRWFVLRGGMLCSGPCYAHVVTHSPVHVTPARLPAVPRAAQLCLPPNPSPPAPSPMPRRHPLADRPLQAVCGAARPPVQRHLGAAGQAAGGHPW